MGLEFISHLDTIEAMAKGAKVDLEKEALEYAAKVIAVFVLMNEEERAMWKRIIASIAARNKVAS